MKGMRALLLSSLNPVLPSTCMPCAISCTPTTLSIKSPCEPSSALDFTLSDYSSLAVIALGKAGSAMAAAFPTDVKQATLPTSSFVITKTDHCTPSELQTISSSFTRHTIHQVSHPVPTSSCVTATESLLSHISSLPPNSLIIALLSGGTSSLLTLPRPPLTLSHVAHLTQILLQTGVDIAKVNRVRSRVDVVKGGGLAKHILKEQGGNTMVTLVLSDVVGDDLNAIGSGPTYFGEGGEEEDDGVMELVTGMLEGELGEALKIALDEPRVATKPTRGGVAGYHRPILIANNGLAIGHLKQHIEEGGGRANIVSNGDMAGEAATKAREVVDMVALAEPGTHLLWGGETTVTFSGAPPEGGWGVGGRNQELALCAAIELKRRGLDACIGVFGTDGTDGPCDAAGAVVDGGTCDRIFDAKGGAGGDALTFAQGFLTRHDSYGFFEGQEEHIKCGATGTNVADVVIAMRS